MTIELRIPDVGESIQEVQIAQWLKHEGDRVRADESVVELETDKASLEIPAPAAGVIAKITKGDGEKVSVGDVIGYLDEQDGAPRARKEGNGQSQAVVGKDEKAKAPQEEKAKPSEKESPKEDRRPSDEEPAQVDKRDEETTAEEERPSKKKKDKKKDIPTTPSARRALREYGLSADQVEPAGKRLRREDVLRYVEQQERQKKEEKKKEERKEEAKKEEGKKEERSQQAPKATEPVQRPAATVAAEAALEEVVPMSLIRRRIAQRLVEAQHTAALLTTFNEIDMSAVKQLRQEHGERFRERYGVKLGFMSFFVKASIDALKQFPEVNAEIRSGDQIAYRNYYHIGIAIGASRGLVVPVLRHAERMSFAEIEKAIGDFARRAEERKLEPQELEGGTFTITNGGVYGSLLSTPIVNPPQSAVLGMHAIQDRPVVRAGEMVVRPMMYVALSYDHRLIDGRQAVTFLKRIKEAIEDPARMLIEA